MAAPLLDKIAPDSSWMVWNRAYNMRMGTQNLTATEVYDLVAQRGMTYGDLLSMPEQDNWMYEQTENSGQVVFDRQMVCDVYVCEVLKAGGVFGQTDFQCTEATNWDLYTLNIFDTNITRPAACVQTDPNLPFCQLLGGYQITLPYYGTRSIHTNSFNKCPRGNAPDWNKPEPC